MECDATRGDAPGWLCDAPGCVRQNVVVVVFVCFRVKTKRQEGSEAITERGTAHTGLGGGGGGKLFSGFLFTGRGRGGRARKSFVVIRASQPGGKSGM